MEWAARRVVLLVAEHFLLREAGITPGDEEV